MELAMDTLYADDGGMFFYPSRTWPEERVVVYGGDTELVPLLRDEVPFDYSFVEHDVVFLWDRNQGVAVLTAREAAWAPWSSVSAKESRCALFGTADDPPGFCYGEVTAGDLSVGPFPTVGELKASGLVAEPDRECFELVGDGVYHCGADVEGTLSFDDLPVSAVVGAATSVSGFFQEGYSGSARGVANGEQMFDRLCVVGANGVDLEQPIVVDPDPCVSRTASVDWFAHRVLPSGACLAMGRVEGFDGVQGGGRFNVVAPEGASALFWQGRFERGLRTYCTRTCDGPAAVGLPGGCHGLYVYAVTPEPFGGTRVHPVKFSGSRFAGCSELVRELVTQDRGCYSVLLLGGNQVLTGDGVTWLDVILANRRSVGPTRSFRDWYVSRVSPSSWHVSGRGGHSAGCVLHRLSLAYDAGHSGAVIEGDYVALSDVVAGCSDMATELRIALVAGQDVSVSRLDECGARLAGLPASLLGFEDKRQQKVLQVVGDAVISLLIAESVYRRRGSAQEFQEVRSVVSSNAFLRDKLEVSRFRGCFKDASGTLAPRTGGSAVEGMVACVYMAGGMVMAEDLVKKLDIVRFE